MVAFMLLETLSTPVTSTCKSIVAFDTKSSDRRSDFRPRATTQAREPKDDRAGVVLAATR